MNRHLLPATLILAACLQFLNIQAQSTTPAFYETNSIQDIKITFEVNDWQYRLDSLRFNNDGFLVGDVEINGELFKNAGIQYRGTKSFRTGAGRNPFNIKLDYSVKGQNLSGYTTIKLSSALRDPSLVREVLGYEIARSYMAAPYANYARITINGEFYGLLVNIESVQDPVFRKRLFGSSNNAFFKANEVLGNEDVDGCKNNIYASLQYEELPKCYANNFLKLSEHGTKDLIDLAKNLDNKPNAIESILNVDATLWMHAFNNVLVNLSSYSGNKSVNYFLYQDNDGKFTPIIWDMNLAFGSYKNIGTGSDLKTRQLFSLDPLLHSDNNSKPLIERLLQNNNYQKVYISHLRTILYDYFTNDKYIERAKELQTMIKVDVINDQNKFYDLDDFENSLEKVIGKNSKIPGLEWLMSKRTDYLKKHPKLTVFPSQINSIEVATREPFSDKKVNSFKITATVGQFPKKVTLMYRFSENEKFSAASMNLNSIGDYETVITPKNGERSIDYYIIAENASMVSYSPPNYMWEHHHTSLEELNK